MQSARLPVFTKSWLALVLAAFVLEVVLFAVFTTLPVSPSDANSLLNSTQGMLNRIGQESFAMKTLDIFANNVRIAAVEFVPGVGWYLFYLATSATSQILSALSVSTGIPSSFILLTLFISPHAWVELLAYAIAVAESVLLVVALTRRTVRAELSRAAASLILAALMLVFAAFLETITLELDLYGIVVAWAVVIVAAYPAYRIFRLLGPRKPASPRLYV